MRTHANRGMGLETLIEYANQQYAAKGIALIQKVPTPWKVIRRGNAIVSAFPEKKSTVDLTGAYRGKPIAFDVKETRNKTSFPLANIEQHQIEFMRGWENNGGRAFFLIEFKEHGERFVVMFDDLIAYKEATKRESIKYEDLGRVVGHRVMSDAGYALHYLKAVSA